jgi:hypothetical protein
MKKKRRDYSMIKKDDNPPKVDPERVRINCSISIDRTSFKKSKAEKLLLKMAKAKAKKSL